MNKWLTEDHINRMLRKPFFTMFPDKVDLLKNGLCTECGSEVTGFKSDLEQREYSISGWCSACQDKMFGE